MVELPTMKCLKCGHEWIPRRTDVRMCPACHNIRWDEPPKKKVKPE